MQAFQGGAKRMTLIFFSSAELLEAPRKMEKLKKTGPVAETGGAHPQNHDIPPSFPCALLSPEAATGRMSEGQDAEGCAALVLSKARPVDRHGLLAWRASFLDAARLRIFGPLAVLATRW